MLDHIVNNLGFCWLKKNVFSKSVRPNIAQNLAKNFRILLSPSACLRYLSTKEHSSPVAQSLWRPWRRHGSVTEYHLKAGTLKAMTKTWNRIPTHLRHLWISSEAVTWFSSVVEHLAKSELLRSSGTWAKGNEHSVSWLCGHSQFKRNTHMSFEHISTTLVLFPCSFHALCLAVKSSIRKNNFYEPVGSGMLYLSRSF